MSCIIIAEIGENHLGDMDLAKKMIEEVAKAGADIAKFQSFKGEDVSVQDPEKEWFYKVELSDKAHRELKKVAENNGIEFLSSPFSVERAKLLCEDLNLRKIKIASSQIANRQLLEYVNKRVDTVFLSTGMADFGEIETAIKILTDVKNIYLLHCISEYPVAKKDVNLLIMKELERRFGLAVGYSDHTIGILACIIAAAIGGKVIEKHFTLDKNFLGTDHILSADPKELTEMVKMIRELDLLLGSPDKKLTSGELKNKSLMRNRFKK